MGEYLEYLVDRGVSPNVASFVGAATARVNVLGFEDRDPDPDELVRMQELVREAMEEGALGVASALIYAPGAYARPRSSSPWREAAGEFGGIYISHLRSEGNQLLEAFEEFMTIARDGWGPGGDLSPQGGRGRELAEDGRGDPAGGGGPGRGPPDHRRHVHLYRRGHRVGCGHAPLGPGRRARSLVRPPEGPRTPAPHRPGDGDPHR